MKASSQRYHTQSHAAAAVLLSALFAGRSVLAMTGQVSSPPEFDAYLAEGYRQMAGVAALATNDERIVDYFRTRNTLANQGGLVIPQKLEPLDLDSWTFHEATYARKELIERLDGGARQYQPLLAAIAQVNFDCWVVPLPHQLGVPDGDECRRRFYFAFAGLAERQQLHLAPSVGVTELVQNPSGAALPQRQLAAVDHQLSSPVVAELDTHSTNCGLHGPSFAFTGPAADSLIQALRKCAGSGAPGADDPAATDPSPDAGGALGSGDAGGGSSGSGGNGTNGGLGAVGGIGGSLGGAVGGVGGAVGDAVGRVGGLVGSAVGAVGGALGGQGKGLGHSRL